MRRARATGQRRDQARDRGVAVTIERAQVDIPRRAAGRAIDPWEMVPACERGADCRREQPGLTLVPSGDQAFRIREHLCAECVLR